MTNSIPICFYPLRKIIVDDDYSFTQSILLKMHGTNFTPYNSPQEALNYLLNVYQPTLSKADLLAKNPQIADSSTEHVINVNIEKLNQMFLNTGHHDISVLFVDYHMPEMNGIDFLKQINHLPIQKALITGEQDYRIGIEAFNSGLVDAYIRKDDPDFATKLHSITAELEWKYFIEMSNLISEIPEFNYLKNIHFVAAFKQFIDANKITAFCLTHIDGNITAQNERNEQKHLLIRDISQLQELSKLAEDDGGSPETIENLNQGKVIPFFGSKEYWQIPANQWEKSLYPADRLGAGSDLVWAIVNT